MTQVIAAPPEKIIDALLDFESHPRWQQHVTSCRVLERDAEGRGTLVEERIDARVRAIRVLARYTYDLPHGLRWEQVEGDVANLSCRYRFEPRPDGSTEVRVDIAFDVGFFVPGPVRRMIRDRALRGSLDELRHRVEG